MLYKASSVALYARSTVSRATSLLKTLIVTVACLFTATTFGAEFILFSDAQWGEANLRLEQSTDRLVESLLRGNPNFEPLAAYSPGSRLRRLSRPVGRLDIRFHSGMTTCTAWLIGDSLILTNHHCIPGDNPDRTVKEASLLLGYYDEMDTSGVERQPVRLQPIESNRQLDYSILQVEGAPGKRWGKVRITASSPKSGDPLILIHHPAGQPMQVTRARCRAGTPIPATGDELFHKCDTLPGSSGAVILSDDAEAAIALHYAGSPNPGPDRHNYGKLIASIATHSSQLRQILSAQGSNATHLPADLGTPAPISEKPRVVETTPAVTMVPPEFKLFGETVQIIYVAARKSQAEALNRRLKEMYAIVESSERWEVPQRFNNRIVVQSSKLEVGRSVLTVSREIPQLNLTLNDSGQGKDIVIWLGSP